MRKIFISFLAILLLISCESKQEKKEREEREKKELIEQAKQAETAREEQEMYDKYISNSLPTGSSPYSIYYGENSYCDGSGCSEIRVRTSDSDVLVTIKENGDVVSHAFIQANNSYTFSFPNGTYQAFFYYGKGWSPEKLMKNGEIEGGFVSDEDFGKDDPQSLYNNVLEYELILQKNGNFSTSPSSQEEAL